MVSLAPSTSAVAPVSRRLPGLLPGVLLCVGVSGAAWALQGVEIQLFGRAWLETLVLAILLGTAVRTLWSPGRTWTRGVEFSAKTLLEAAVVLLGATIDARAMAGAGIWLIAGIAGLVALAIAGSYAIGRLFRLPKRMAVLIACGNAICGNSAIAAVAPVIGADGEDVSASIAFTAALGVAVVLGLPPLAAALHLDHRGFGVFAGLTVYAVPQVLAATAPVSALSAQIGTVVKLVRVLMLGPVVAVLGMLNLAETALVTGAPRGAVRRRPRLAQLAPWFILGFLLLAGLRSTVALPANLTAGAGSAATALTIVSMAALGLGVDVRALVRAGPRVTAVVTLSLVLLGVVALALVRALGIR
jgi:uncharacterized integral membrane protein (TIGR00698 family)